MAVAVHQGASDSAEVPTTWGAVEAIRKVAPAQTAHATVPNPGAEVVAQVLSAMACPAPNTRLREGEHEPLLRSHIPGKRQRYPVKASRKTCKTWPCRILQSSPPHNADKADKLTRVFRRFVPVDAGHVRHQHCNIAVSSALTFPCRMARLHRFVSIVSLDIFGNKLDISFHHLSPDGLPLAKRAARLQGRAERVIQLAWASGKAAV